MTTQRVDQPSITFRITLHPAAAVRYRDDVAHLEKSPQVRVEVNPPLMAQISANLPSPLPEKPAREGLFLYAETKATPGLSSPRKKLGTEIATLVLTSGQ